ncbi:MAG: rRNA maturation RNAse YbeY [Lachnospiraceae bacterium]|nr:rRNA maturation RNAse YbeY [Lachnospiraceae bacterium]
MASNLKVIIDNPQVKIKIPSGTRMLVRRSCHATLQHEHYDSKAQIYVDFADNDLLNEYAQYRNGNFEAPEVIAIPPEEEGESLGKLIISVERITELVQVYRQPFEMGVVYASVHGVLNLFGQYYTDPEVKDAQMVKEARILTELGYPPLASYGSLS